MVEIRKIECPESQAKIKCPHLMTPTRIVVHNTANDASAANEISYMHRNSNYTSFHFAVDDVEIIQGIDLNRNAWHAGDGATGIGNRFGIGIEICYSKSGGERFIKAEQNAAELVAYLLNKYGWGIDKVTKHQDYSGKYCPHRTLDMGWDRFLDMVKAAMNEEEPKVDMSWDQLFDKIKDAANKEETKEEAAKVAVGAKVKVNKGAKSYEGKGIASFVYNNTYTVDQLKGDRAVLDEDGLCTAFNVKDLSVVTAAAKPAQTTTKPVTTTNSSTKYKVGDKVKFTHLCTNSAGGGKVKAAITSGTITKVVAGAKAPYLVGNGLGWLSDDMITGNTTTSTPAKKTYKVGDKVKFTHLCTSSAGTKKVRALIKTGKITKIKKGAKAPYLINGILGWLSEDMITG